MVTREYNETNAHGHELVYLDCFPGRKFHTNFKKSSFASKLGSAPLAVSNLKYALIIFKNKCHKKIDKMHVLALFNPDVSKPIFLQVDVI